MKILVFNSKGGCGKSLLAREIIAAPIAKEMTVIEIDTLNKTQSAYKSFFKDVVELSKADIKNLLVKVNELDNVVIDVGADHLSDTFRALVDYSVLEDFDLVVIPMTQGRTDCENALKSYAKIKPHTDKIIFAFSKCKEDEKLEDQYQVFFNNLEKHDIKSIEGQYVTIYDSDCFIDAQNAKLLVVDMAAEVDYKAQAKEAKSAGDMASFHKLMKKELEKRAARILVDKCIMPAHKQLMGN